MRSSAIRQHSPTFLVLDTDRELLGLLKEAKELDSLVPAVQIPGIVTTEEPDEIRHIRLVEKFPLSVMDMIANVIMESIMYEQHARQELNYACLDLVKEELGTECVESWKRLANLINSFGEDILSKLQCLRAYQNGYLYYQFHAWYGNDLVLSRLDVEKINPNL